MIQTAQVGVGIAGREGGVWAGACFFRETASQVGTWYQNVHHFRKWPGFV